MTLSASRTGRVCVNAYPRVKKIYIKKKTTLLYFESYKHHNSYDGRLMRIEKYHPFILVFLYSKVEK